MRLPSSSILFAGVACLVLAGCSEEKASEPTAPRSAQAVVVQPHKLVLVAQGAGRIHARYESDVGFEVAGRLVSRLVETGTVVKKGQKLAELSAVDFRNKLTASGS